MSKLPVVIVEDDESISENLRYFLELEGFQTHSAGNGKEGLEVIRGLHGACLVLLDLQMPVMTGEQLLEALKSEPSAVRNVPVVVISARNEPPQSRVQAFLRKPIDIEKLLEIVSKLTVKS